MANKPTSFLLQTFEDNFDELLALHTNLGWRVAGVMRKPNELRPERGDAIFINLEWPADLGEPVRPDL